MVWQGDGSAKKAEHDVALLLSTDVYVRATQIVRTRHPRISGIPQDIQNEVYDGVVAEVAHARANQVVQAIGNSLRR